MSATNPLTDPNRDVVVLGGGPAGAAAALALARRGLRVALIHQPRRGARVVGETVPPTIKRSLARLGLWKSFLVAGHQRSAGTVVIWGKEDFYENEFILNPYGCGWHLDREAFDRMLLAAAVNAGVEIHRVVASPQCRTDGRDGFVVLGHTETGRVILNAQWLIDATGRRAWLARRYGIRRCTIDHMVAVVRFGRCSSGENRTIVEARPTGWWYAAQLPNKKAVAAFFTDADLMPRGESAWRDLVSDTRLVGEILVTSDGLSPVVNIAASSGRLEACVGDNWIAIGDAAQCYDPCSGQGIVKALDAATAAAELISTQTATQRPNLQPLQERADAEFREYLLMRSTHYRRERRWAGNVFWARRAD